jgi:hypothetical protein
MLSQNTPLQWLKLAGAQQRRPPAARTPPILISLNRLYLSEHPSKASEQPGTEEGLRPEVSEGLRSVVIAID